MRERSRTLGTRQVSGPWSRYRHAPEDTISGSWEPFDLPSGDEKITDEENGPYNMRTKYVCHQKAKNEYALFPATYTLHGSYSPTYGKMWDETYYLPAPPILNWELAKMYDPPDVGPSPSLCRKAMDKITPTLESGFDATVFVSELGEAKTLFTAIKSTASYFRNFSNANLTYAFGWAPMVKDLTKLVKALYNYQARIKRFKEESKKDELKRYFRNISKEDYTSDWFKISDPKNYGFPGGTVYDYAQVKWTRNITENFTFRYTYTIPELTEDQEKIYAFLDTVGLHADGAVLWELLPYSFVVDWFIPIGDYFQRKRRKWWPATITMQNCTYSRKVEQTTYLSFRYNYEDTGLQYLFMVRKIEKYVRYPLATQVFYSVPDDYVDTTDKLSLRKIFLGSLLMEQAVTESEIKRIMRSH